MGMNRIYQGRVSKVEIPKPGDKANPWQPLPNWQDILWQHHELFQDAVNYYIVCLLALAGDLCAKQRELRNRMTTKPEGGNEEPLYVWDKFRRRGAWRRGLGDSVAPYLCPGKADVSSEECFAAARAGCEASNEGQDLAFSELLFVCDGDNPIKNQGRWMFDRFCNPKYTGSFPFDATADLREKGEARLKSDLHKLSNQSELESFSQQAELGWVVNLTRGANTFEGEFARERLLKSVVHFQQAFGAKANTEMSNRVSTLLSKHETAKKELDDIAQHIKAMAADALPKIPANNRGIADRVEAFMLFKQFPSAFTVELLKVSFPKDDALKAEKPQSTDAPEIRFTRLGGDAIELARGRRRFVFRAFTSLPSWGGDNSGIPQWLNFDVAAFKESLKAIHQVDDKAKEREEERNQKLAQHKYQLGETKKWKGGGAGEEEQRPPVLAGDPRITRLEHLVDVELRAEYEMSEGVEVKYGLHPRTIRGFRDVRKLWNEALQPGQSYSAAVREQLWKLLTDFKKENAETMGSPVLFDALVEEANWIIWCEPDATTLTKWRKAAGLSEGAEFCADPLQALTDERELLAEIERLQDPIRLTPADPQYSRRQFYFSDVSDLTKKDRLRHDRSYLDVEIAEKLEGKWMPRLVRIHFSAPRLLRDQLKSDEDGKESAWQQAMMAALGLKAGLVKKEKGKLRPASFAECAAVALMPEVTASGERRILLNFPLTLEDDAVARQLGKAARWDANQFGPNFKNSSWLRWPSTPDANARSRPWWESSEPFRCLPVDLGQRDAGAFALLEVTPGTAPKPQSRKLGNDGSKNWWATVRATGMLRLPGEDAKVFRDGNPKPQDELSGERGRNLVAGEWEESRDICTALGFQPDKLLGADNVRYSFPQLNDRLLYALRRAQARLARLQSWSSVAYKEPDEKKWIAFEKRRKRIKEQIAEAITIRTAEESKAEKDRGQELIKRSDWLNEVKPLMEKEAWDAVATRIKAEIKSEREIIKRELVRIADRIQPLRGRWWEWVTRPNDTQNHILQQTERGTDDRAKLLAGQRGLSMKRIEQLDSLRQRCQSLNRALRQEPGKPANLGRSKRGIELPDPCPELLDRMEALKEQRVNQTAHLILAQALGVRLRSHTTSAAEREKHDIHGEYERIPGREPVDFVIIENLKYYEMTQGRARSENARLMKWCRRHLRDKLIQLCEPYGLRVLEEWPADTSKFCSLTSVAGFRAVELTPEDAKEFRWKKHLDRLDDPERAKKLNKPERRESQRVQQLFGMLAKVNADLLKDRPKRPKWRTLLAPVAGGPIFVPMRGNPFQADINAAINLGLRAIAAPETGEIHLRIRSENKSGKFLVRADNIREKARWKGSKPPEIIIPDEKHRADLLAEARPNFYADLGGVADFDKAEVSGQQNFASGRGLWGTIKGNERREGKDWLRVDEINRARIQKKERGNDDVPM